MTQDPEFAESHGITNGAAWYPVFGGLQVSLQFLNAVLRMLHSLEPEPAPAATNVDRCQPSRPATVGQTLGCA
jgi:hypothetical protein